MYRVILTVFLASAQAQLTLPGTCGNETNTLFQNLTALSTWQEVQRIPNQLETGQCSSISLPRASNSSQYVLSIREVFNHTAVVHNGTVQAYSTGRVTVNFSGTVIDLRVLRTDGSNYALVYGCRNAANNTKQVYGWKLSKNPTLSSSDASLINSAVNGTDLQNVNWTTVSHTTDACKVNSAGAAQVSLLLYVVAAILAVFKA